VLAVMAADDLDDAISLQNATTFGLTGGLHSLDPEEITRWVAQVEVGNAYVNRTTTGAVVARQPFGGWKRSVVGPAAKAGGPHHVASLCDWRDRGGSDRGGSDASGSVRGDGGRDRLARATASYASAWASLSEPRDLVGLVAERNEHRHLPLRTVVLRVEADADPLDVELCRLGARTVGTELVISDAAHEPVDDLMTRWPALRPDRIRVLGTAPAALRRAANDAWLPVDDRRPVADGGIELPRWCREQSVSTTAHRHGNTRAT
jgi:RHH-type proline utilization regulon transcriptional repressor/proline dehydrogenase/delta 1-pyrroline-5-carboxylate dehydrogenase